MGNQKTLSPNTFLWSLGQKPYVLGDNAQTLVGSLNDQFANQDIKWEIVEDLSAGIDMAFLNNKITATVEVYSK